jgi:dTDP-4-amino-4,6-dideoxygalactose transaminase
MEQYKDIELPVTDLVSRNCFSLPVYPELKDETVDVIVDTIKAAL